MLITGFTPFGGSRENPTETILQRLPPSLPGMEIHTLLLPVVFKTAGEKALKEAMRLDADAVLSLGLAAGRTAVTPERTAVNCMDARIPDNAGNLPRDQAILADGPAALFSTLPIRKMEVALTEQGISAAVSESAGCYVCNDVFYRILAGFGIRPGKRSGFLHIPWAEGQGTPCLPMNTLVKAVEICLTVIATAGSR
jgi:pyroglutamyl-peptidase